MHRLLSVCILCFFKTMLQNHLCAFDVAICVHTISLKVDDAIGRFKPRLFLQPVSRPRRLSFQGTDLHPVCASQHIFRLANDHNCNSYSSPFSQGLGLLQSACFYTRLLLHLTQNTLAIRFWIIYRSGVVYLRQSN